MAVKSMINKPCMLNEFPCHSIDIIICKKKNNKRGKKKRYRYIRAYLMTLTSWFTDFHGPKRVIWGPIGTELVWHVALIVLLI